MARILLYDGSCAACSATARYAQSQCADELSIASLTDPAVLGKLRAAGLEPPTRPALLIDDEDDLRLLTGLRMRIALTRTLGWRRSRTATRLLTQELRARAVRDGGLSRRAAMALGLGGVVAAVLGRPGTAAAKQPAHGSRASVPSSALVAKVLGTRAAREAASTWGEIDVGRIMEVRGSGEHVLAVPHRGSSVVTMIDAAASDPIAIGMESAQVNGRPTLRFYLIDGRPIGDLYAIGGRLGTRVVEDPAGHRADLEARADVNRVQLTCFIACIGGETSFECADTCANCDLHPANWLTCGECFWCAGAPGVKCAKRCFRNPLF